MLEAEADRAAMRRDIVAAEALLSELVHAQPRHIAAWMKLAAIRRAGGDTAGALVAAEGALATSPLDFTALLLRANLLERMGHPEADEAYGRAVAQRPAGDLPAGAAAAMAHAERRFADFVARREAALLEAAAPVMAGLMPDETRRVERLASNVVHRTRVHHSEPTQFHYPGLVEREFHDDTAMPWRTALEAESDVIAAEFAAVAAAEHAELVPYVQYPEHEPLQQWRSLNHSRDWTAIHLMQNGRTIAANARHCPRTMAALAKLPQPRIAGCSPNAMFSLLGPGITIPPHHGVANTRLVCHLPLIVPDGCWFRVGAETRRWRRGEALLFDDTIEHEAANPSDMLRVVLICDVWHPGLGAREREAVRLVMANTEAAAAGL